MVGMNDGAMPQPVSSSSLITDEEKKVFEQQAQVELSPTSDILQMDEAFVCYIAMTRGSEQVTFSYSLMGAQGEDKEKKSIYRPNTRVVQWVRSNEYSLST